MTSLNAAQLPSDDEEDDDYDPTGEELSAAGTSKRSKGNQSNKKRRRGDTASVPEPEADETADQGLDELADAETPGNSAKKAKVDQLWAQLNKGKASKQPAGTHGSTPEPVQAVQQDLPAAKAISLAAFCRPVASKTKADGDAVGMTFCSNAC